MNDLKRCKKCNEIIYFKTKYDLCPTCSRIEKEKAKRKHLIKLREANRINQLNSYKERPLTKDTMWIVWMWVYRDKMSFEDIAHLLQRPISQIRDIYYEAVKKYRKEVV